VRPQKQQKVMELHAPQTGEIDDTDKSVIGKRIPNNEFRMKKENNSFAVIGSGAK